MTKKRTSVDYSQKTDPRILQAPTLTQVVQFPASMNNVLVLNFVQEDKCYDYVGMDGNGNKIYKQVTCPWDTITFFDEDEPGG